MTLEALAAPYILPHTIPESPEHVAELMKDGILDPKSAAAYLVPHQGHFCEVKQERAGKLIALRLSTHLDAPPAANIRTNLGGIAQARLMFGASLTATTGTGFFGQAGTPTSTTLPDSASPAWTTNQWANYLVACTSTTATPTVMAYGVILSNTAGTLTIDRWYNPKTPAGSAATTPAASTCYGIYGMAPLNFMALSTDAGSVVSDYAWTGECTTNNLDKLHGLYTQTFTNPSASGNASTQTVQMVGSITFTANGSTAAIVKAALCNSGVASTGLYSLIAAFSSVSVISGDTVTPSYTIVM